jgi:hypothetical protein
MSERDVLNDTQEIFSVTVCCEAGLAFTSIAALTRALTSVPGAGFNLTPEFGIVGEFGYNHHGLSRGALSAAGVPDGVTRI